MGRVRIPQLLSNFIIISLLGFGIYDITTRLNSFKMAVEVEKNIYNLLFRLKKSNNKIDPNLVIINISPRDVQYYGHVGPKHFPDISLQIYTKLLQKINKTDFDFAYMDIWSDIHKKNKHNVDLFVEKAGQMHNLVIGLFFFIENIPDEFKTLPEIYFNSHTAKSYEKPMYSYIHPTSQTTFFAYDRIIEKYLSQKTGTKVSLLNHSYFKSKMSPNRLWRYGAKSGFLINYVGHGTFPSYDVKDVLAPSFDIEKLRNKKIFIGNSNYFIKSDWYYNRLLTPIDPLRGDFNKEGTAWIEVFVNIINNVITERGIKILPKYFDYTLTIIFCIFLFVCWLFFNPQKILLFFVGGNLLLIILNLILMSYFYYYLPLVIPIYFSILTMSLGGVTRLMKENYHLWQARQKRRVLEDSKDLKENFISLISHNLNTPIAKIRNLMEVILYDPQTSLEPDEKKTILDVSKITVFLEKYFHNILQLTKLEQAAFQLSLQSKDINQIIETLMNDFIEDAEAKSINIRLETTPLFPIKIDVNLFSSLIYNLIDNAVKYGNSNADFIIETLEENENVLVKFITEGTFFSLEETQRVFEKFYRCQNAIESNEIGVGIGLYLSRYFARLHKGDLVCQLTDNKTIFVLTMPC